MYYPRPTCSCTFSVLKANIWKSSTWQVIHGKKRKKQRRKTENGRRRWPELLTASNRRGIQSAIAILRQHNPNFTVMELVKTNGINLNAAHYRTFLSEIQKLVYKFRQSRRKAVLTQRDLIQRLMFARAMCAKSAYYWTKDVAFNLGGVSFIFKGNSMSDAVKPKSKVWQKLSEGLILTTKGSKYLARAKRLFDCSHILQ